MLSHVKVFIISALLVAVIAPAEISGEPSPRKDSDHQTTVNDIKRNQLGASTPTGNDRGFPYWALYPGKSEVEQDTVELLWAIANNGPDYPALQESHLNAVNSWFSREYPEVPHGPLNAKRAHMIIDAILREE